jgi:polysaccharide export outer membrane protein
MKSAILIVLLLLSGCATRRNYPVFAEIPGMQRPPESHRITPGDRIHLPSGTDPQSPTVEVTVDSEGDIELPRVGKVPVVGMTREEAGYRIWHAYSDQGLVPPWPPPQPVIPTFRVSGEVAWPGKHEYPGRMTLTKAVEFCGGLTPTARRSELLIRRRDGSIEHHDYTRIKKSRAPDPAVWPGDVIEVKRKPAW